MKNEITRLLSGAIVEEDSHVSFNQLCHCCSLSEEQIISMIEHGIIEPLEPLLTSSYWQFSGGCIIRIQTAVRLQHDLEINLAGTALALELLDEIRNLRQQVKSLQRD
ncbi:MAG: MerR family transcriptional regulator [Gammaproteobacteria bacterium]|jgi:chaperone modulatory protein CbpM|nr:MerR family transcriptional regulator [Gammaproteobacteria bacterium]MBT4147261.1 MerR family transcriptional regulator [Gammaproteobacteria bacterium]MBT5221390.1 MerR family transcriptional regulator [Gammaproteobacteria bacterium]MBT5825955.1 MerR family transcriptional regulator [Gammaproteobacteria bacterium]MBT5966593.1 MerR family transcriptional regulator [Gammaproteobacteria bacterium]